MSSFFEVLQRDHEKLVLDAKQLRGEIERGGGRPTKEQIARADRLKQEKAALDEQIEAEKLLRAAEGEIDFPAAPDGGGPTRRESLAEEYQATGLVRIIEAACSGGELPEGVTRTKDGINVPHRVLAAPGAIARAATAVSDIGVPSEVMFYPLVRAMPTLSWLGVFPEMQEPGDLEGAWMTGAPAAVTAAEDSSLAAVTINANTWSKVKLARKRTYAAGGLTAEAEYGADRVDSMITQDRVAEVGDGIEKQVLVGNGTAPNAKGVFTAAKAVRAAPAAGAGNSDSYGKIIAAVEGLPDGKLINRPDQLYGVCHPLAAGALAGVIANTGNETARSTIDRITAGLRVSAHAPAPVTTNGETVQVLFRRGRVPGAYLFPMWNSLRVIVDTVTGAPAGTKYYVQSIWNFVAAEDRVDGNNLNQDRGDWVTVSFRTKDGS